MTEHTPLPWSAKGTGRLEIYGPDDEWCASCHAAYKHTRSPANAALIVKAVNAYGPLVEALTECRNLLRLYVGEGATIKNAIAQADQALDQALKDIGEDTP